MNEKISPNRKKYLRKIKVNKLAIILTQIGIIIAFILLWEILANAKLIDSFITSQPSRIFQTLTNLSSNNLLKHLWVTLYETIIRIFIWDLHRNFNCNYFMAF